MSFVLAVMMAFLCSDVFSGEVSRGDTEYHQIIYGDPDSYEAFERSFFVSESPILKLAKHSSLCSLDLQNPEHMAIRNTHFVQKREEKHRYISTHIPCSLINAISKNNPLPMDATQLYILEGLSPSRDDSMTFLRSAAELILTEGKLSKANVATLAGYLGVKGVTSDVYDSGMNASGLPFVTFSTIDTDPNKVNPTTKHRLVSAYSTDSGIYIYERERISSNDGAWQPLDIKRHGKSVSLLQFGVKNAKLDSLVLDNQPEAEGGYFLENVAFSLSVEFDVNNFGDPLLIVNWYEPVAAGHIVQIIDSDTIRRDEDWLYFTDSSFMSLTAPDEPTLNLATNLPKVIIKRKLQVSCKRRLGKTLAMSAVPAGAKDKWFSGNPQFEKMDDYLDVFILIACSPLSSPRDPYTYIRNLEKIYNSDLFQIDNYSTSAARLLWESTIKKTN